jgi:hypothetical protein
VVVNNLPCGESSAPGPKKNDGAPNTAPTPSNPDGSPAPGTPKPGESSSSSETSCKDGICITNTSTAHNNGDGTTTTKDDTKEETKDSFCKENPASELCKDKQSSIAGACNAVTCTGDAIQCAIAREQAKRNCELFDANDASARGITAAAAGDRPGDHPANASQDIPLGQGFDQTNIISGSCPGDLVVPVGSRSVVIPFSKLCTPAAWLANLLVGITALACLGIVFKGN